MSYIYVLTNLVNWKKYVGKTEMDPIKRFKEHLADAKKPSERNRPLYRAINKYGEMNFSVTPLEECSPDVVNEREIYWISKLNTYGKSGYNATKGGDGKSYVNIENLKDIVDFYKNENNVSIVTGLDTKTIRKYCKNEKDEAMEYSYTALKQPVVLLQKNTNKYRIFPSRQSAAKWLCTDYSKLVGITPNINKTKGIASHLKTRGYANGWFCIDLPRNIIPQPMLDNSLTIGYIKSKNHK